MTAIAAGAGGRARSSRHAYYDFELGEFHRFLAAAKRIRAAVGMPAPMAADKTRTGTARRVTWNVLQFVGVVLVLLVVFPWLQGFGYWAIPAALGISCIPMLLTWAFNRLRGAK